MNWTLDETETLRRMRDEGKTTAETAKALGRTVDGVKNRIALLGLPTKERHNWTPEEDAKLREMWAGKATDSELEQAIGRTSAACWKRASRLKLESRMKGRPRVVPKNQFKGWWDESKCTELEKLWLEGKSAREIGLQLHTSRMAVIGKANRLGLSNKKADQARELRFPTYTPSTCQWIDGDPPAEYSYCGAEVKLGSSYCEEHHAVCYRKTDTEPKYGERPVTNWGPLQSGLVA